jgi:hypothetical protein
MSVYGESSLHGPVVDGGAVSRPVEFTVLQNQIPVPASGTSATCRLSDLVSAGNPMKLNTCLQTTFRVVVPTPEAADAVTQMLNLRGRSGSKPETRVFLNVNYPSQVKEHHGPTSSTDV